MSKIHEIAARIFKIEYSDIPERQYNERKLFVSNLISKKVWGQGPSYTKIVEHLVNEIKERSNIFIDSYQKAIINEGFLNDELKETIKQKLIEFIKKQITNTYRTLDDYLNSSEMPDNVKMQNYNTYNRKAKNIINIHTEKISHVLDLHNESLSLSLSSSKYNNSVSKQDAIVKLEQLILGLPIVEEELYNAIDIMRPRFQKVLNDENVTNDEVRKENQDLKNLKAQDKWCRELENCIQYFFDGKSSRDEYIERAQSLNFGYLNNVKDRQGFKNAEILIRDMIDEINKYWPDSSILNENKIYSRNPWISGSFYLFTFVTIVLLFLIIVKYVNWVYLPFVIIGSLICLSLIGAFQLRQDKNLSEKSFIELVALTFKQLPFLKKKD